MKKKLLKTGLLAFCALLAIGLLSGFASADTNPDDNWDDTTDGGSAWEVVLSTDHKDSARWENVFAGSNGWGDDEYVLNWPGGGLEIHCYDGFLVGDYYSVWLVDTATDTLVSLVFTTPQVETGPLHTCTGYPWSGYHTGLGTTYSDGTYFIYLMPGTYEFKARDELLLELWAEGIDPRPTWSPAGFWIGFHSAPHIIPDVPLGTVVAGSIMMVCLVAYFGATRARVFRRRH